MRKINTKKKKKEIQTGEETNIFPKDLICWVENPKQSTKKAIRTNKWFLASSQETKISCISMLAMKNFKLKLKIKSPYNSLRKYMKFLGENLIKHVKFAY